MNTTDTRTATCEHGVSIAQAYGMIYPLTPCCGASATGSFDCVACRNCYAEVDPMLGDCVTDGDPARVRSWFAEQGCLTPDVCAAHALTTVTAA